ncbi:hypothetical protein KPH14_003007 [Odynerus spinipes]|uniref:Uncharacterized protein n=1 Tax=Odynerus spinipes TaxID=1348599 RepID=A0AAD9RWL3_9HYME|nr:hypothetical protein KPH14_003007 [Odynerus spinipes]
MDQRAKKYSDIDYEEEDIIGQINKRFKQTKQGLIDDIASSIESVAKSTKSISENHAVFLEVNKALTLFLLETERKKKEINFAQTTSTSSVQERLENTSLEPTS